MDLTKIQQLGHEEILQILPHRYPFLLVDRVLEVKTAKPLHVGMSKEEMHAARVGSYARTLKNVTFNEIQFQGHFPENPVFPGVLTLECMAQSAAFLTAPFAYVQSGGTRSKMAVALAGFDGARFRRPIRPGDQLLMHVVATNVKGSLWAFHGEVTVDGKKAAESDFLAQLLLPP